MPEQSVILASQNYPLLNLFWTMLWLFLWILWIFLLIRIILDLFRSADLSGWAKAGWCVLLLILPLIGVLIYLGVRGSGMADRELGQMQARDAAMRSYVQQAAAATAPSTADELAKLSALRDQGVLTDTEFAAQKAKLLI